MIETAVHFGVSGDARPCWREVRKATAAIAESECARRKIRANHQRVLFGEKSLRTAIHNFIAHYHTERNHQGLANRLISPQAAHLGNTGAIQRRQRLGGMLNYYYRTAA